MKAVVYNFKLKKPISYHNGVPASLTLRRDPNVVTADALFLWMKRLVVVSLDMSHSPDIACNLFRRDLVPLMIKPFCQCRQYVLFKEQRESAHTSGIWLELSPDTFSCPLSDVTTVRKT